MKAKGRTGWLHAALLIALLLVTLAPVAPAQAAAVRLDPALSALVSTNPLARYPIILEAATPLPAAAGLDTNLVRTQQAAGLITLMGGRLTGQLPLIGAAAGDLPGSAILSLAANPAVAYLSFDSPLTGAAVPVATAYPVEVGAPRAWDLGYTGRGVTIAILDSGILPVDDLGK